MKSAIAFFVVAALGEKSLTLTSLLPLHLVLSLQSGSKHASELYFGCLADLMQLSLGGEVNPNMTASSTASCKASITCCVTWPPPACMPCLKAAIAPFM